MNAIHAVGTAHQYPFWKQHLFFCSNPDRGLGVFHIEVSVVGKGKENTLESFQYPSKAVNLSKNNTFGMLDSVIFAAVLLLTVK